MPVIFHLLAVPAEADPEHQATAGEHVERGGRLRQGDRIMLGHERDTRADLQAGPRGHERQRHVGIPEARIAQRCRPARRELASRGLHGQVRVLVEEQPLESPPFGLDSEVENRHGEVCAVREYPDLRPRHCLMP